MIDKKFDPFNVTWWFILIVALLVLWISSSWGSSSRDEIEQETEVIVEVSTGDLNSGDLVTGDNKTITVVAPGLGDVDIAQCLGSTQWSLLVGGKQKLVLNQVCMAEFYLKQGRYELAAQALCNQPEILEEYVTEQACEDDHDFGPVVEPTMLGDLYDRNAQFDEHYELAQQQEEEIEFLQEEQASLSGRIEQLTMQIEQAPTRTQAKVIEPPERYSDEQFDQVWSILQQSKEEDDE